MIGMRPGTEVNFGDRQWIIKLICDGFVTLEDADTGELASALITDVQRENPAADRLIAYPEATAGADLPELTAHIRELVDGTPAVGTAPRPQYATSLPLMGRYETKRAELEMLGHKVGLSTLRDHRSKYLKSGPAGLLDRRTIRDVRWIDKYDHRVIEMAAAVVKKAGVRSSTSYRAMAGQVRAEFKTKWPDAVGKLPSVSELSKIVKRLSEASDPTGSARARQTANNSPARVNRPRPAVLPGSEVMLDSTRIDVLLRGDDGKPFRPELAIMCDKATRSIITFSVLRQHKAVDIAFMIADANTPPALRPTSYDTIARQYIENLELPWITSFEAGAQEILDARRPAFSVRRIVTDNGAEYRSAVLESACRQLDIEIVRSSVYTPTDKAIVERAFRTINTEFLTRLPGYTGGSVERRAEHPENEALLTVEEFVYLLDAWIALVWQNEVHKGLTCPFWPSSQALTPNQMYAAYFPFMGYVPQALSRPDYISLMPTTLRTLQSKGIEFSSRLYDSEELRDYRQDYRNQTKNKRFTVSYHPHFLSRIWVHLPGEPQPVECTDNDRGRESVNARDVWELATRIRDSYSVLDDTASEDATWDLIAEATRRRQEIANKENRAAEAQRLLDAQGRTVEFGRNSVTGTNGLVDDIEDLDLEYDEEDDVPDDSLLGA